MANLENFYRGDDSALELRITDSDGDPVDASDWRFVWTLKLSSETPDTPELDASGSRLVLSVSSTTAGMEDAKDGIVVLVLPHTETAQLLPARYETDIQLQSGDTVQTVYRGSVTVLADVYHGSVA